MRTKAMSAAVITAPLTAAVHETPVPEPGPGEVLIRVEGCGVCGSSVPVWEGRASAGYPLAPGEPGHEGWGVVEETGERVAFLSGRAYAKYAVARTDELVPIGQDGPVPGEALGCVMNIFRRSAIRSGERVAVVGVGFLGALLVQLAVRAGAEVIAVSRRQTALEVARAMGAAEATTDAARYEEQCDCVIEAAGAQATLDLASRLARVRGRIVIAGYHQDGPRQVDLQSWNWRGLDVVNAHERDPRVYVEGMRLAIEAIAERRLDPAPLYTHTFPLDRLGDALEAARTRPEGFMKALVLS